MSHFTTIKNRSRLTTIEAENAFALSVVQCKGIQASIKHPVTPDALFTVASQSLLEY